MVLSVLNGAGTTKFYVNGNGILSATTISAATVSAATVSATTVSATTIGSSTISATTVSAVTLTINSVPAGTSVKNLAVDISGNVVTGIRFYAENSTPPANPPIATGGTSIAIGDGAQALASNMFVVGNTAGKGASAAIQSNFIGPNAGSGATNASVSNFLGNSAGFGASNASSSNFLGQLAGFNATNASTSNFLGDSAGQNATGAFHSNFLGANAGKGATSAKHSHFFGNEAGSGATSAERGIFIGQAAGKGASNALYSTLLGWQAGMSFTSNNISSNNIIIGTNVSLPDATSSSLNIGGVLFGTGLFSTNAGNPSITAQTAGRIGINNVTPSQALDVVGNIIASGTITPSDRRLKENIVEIENALVNVMKMKPVGYDKKWLIGGELKNTEYGFIAQDLKEIFTDNKIVNTPEIEGGILSVNYISLIAVLTKAIQELSSGITTTTNTYLETQTILAEDNNIDLNFNGTLETAIGGGISIINAKPNGDSAELKTDENGNWITNNALKPNELIIPIYTPSATTDTNGSIGSLTRDDDYLYLKSINGWKRTNFENF
jgi:hypothetical protein